MKVREIMVNDVACCSPRANAAALAQLFWDGDCGAVPVVDDENRVLGVVTDRELAIALGTRDKRPSEVTVAEIMSGPGVATVSPEADLGQALSVMHEMQVGRLPVVDAEGTLVGLLFLGHLARKAHLAGAM